MNAEEMFDRAHMVAKLMNKINNVLSEKGLPEMTFEELTKLSVNEMIVLQNLLERNK